MVLIPLCGLHQLLSHQVRRTRHLLPAAPRASSPVLEPDTSAINCTRPIDLGFRVNINHRFEHSTVKLWRYVDDI